MHASTSRARSLGENSTLHTLAFTRQFPQRVRRTVAGPVCHTRFLRCNNPSETTHRHAVKCVLLFACGYYYRTSARALNIIIAPSAPVLTFRVRSSVTVDSTGPSVVSSRRSSLSSLLSSSPANASKYSAFGGIVSRIKALVRAIRSCVCMCFNRPQHTHIPSMHGCKCAS